MALSYLSWENHRTMLVIFFQPRLMTLEGDPKWRDHRGFTTVLPRKSWWNMASKTCSRPQKIWKYRDLEGQVNVSLYSQFSNKKRVLGSFSQAGCKNTPADLEPGLSCVAARLFFNVLQKHPHGSLNVPIEHHPTIRYMVYNGYYKVMSNSPKMGHLPIPDPRNISGRTHTCDVSQRTNCCLKAVLADFADGALNWQLTQQILVGFPKKLPMIQ